MATRIRADGRRTAADRTRPRRTPRQARSRWMVAVILEAAARVFAERGIDGASTNLIAERAGVSIGSLYQFFPGKSAVLAALVEHYRQDLRALWDEVLTPEACAAVPVQVSVDRIVDALWRLADQRPGFIRLMHGGQVSPDLAPAESALLAEARERIGVVVAAIAPGRPAAEVGHVARVASCMTHAFLAMLELAPADARPALLAQVKLALAAYLSAAPRL